MITLPAVGDLIQTDGLDHFVLEVKVTSHNWARGVLLFNEQEKYGPFAVLGLDSSIQFKDRWLVRYSDKSMSALTAMSVYREILDGIR